MADISRYAVVVGSSGRIKCGLKTELGRSLNANVEGVNEDEDEDEQGLISKTKGLRMLELMLPKDTNELLPKAKLHPPATNETLRKKK